MDKDNSMRVKITSDIFLKGKLVKANSVIEFVKNDSDALNILSANRGKITEDDVILITDEPKVKEPKVKE